MCLFVRSSASPYVTEPPGCCRKISVRERLREGSKVASEAFVETAKRKSGGQSHEQSIYLRRFGSKA